jgi:phage terminase large subunit-like protein
VWKSCGGKVIEFGDAPVWAGLDLSARTDLTALCLVGKVNNTWQIKCHFWTPEKGLLERAKKDRQPYDVWARQGYLHTTPGHTVDYEFLAQDITAILSDLNVQGVAYDRWRIDIFRKELSHIGVELPLVEYGQGFKDMSGAIDTLEAELLNGRIAHGNDPVLTMCAANAIITKDSAGNRKLDKSKATGRIDGLVAMAMAFGVFNKAAVAEQGDLDGFLNNPLSVKY